MKPTGKVTFLFTDIEGSTKLAQRFPDTLQSALDRHHSIMQNAVESNNGFVFEIIGDAFCCAFEKAEDAVKAAVDAQLNLANEKWDEVVIKVRIGIHSGNAEWNGNRYMGYIALARSARVMSAAYGEQIIISNNTYDLCKYEFAASKEKEISFRDLGERRLKDVIQPIRLFQILSPGLREDFPSLKTLDARPNNLPVQLTNFIGRENEITEIKKILSVNKILTLLGSGGTGKTRLSLQVGAEVIDEFENGVWIVELASLQNPSLVTQSLAETFGLKEQAGMTLEKILIDFLSDKEILLILDNCEHLIDACAQLTEKLLQNSSKLKMIATSREALRCEGEFIHKVSSLAHPDPKEMITAEKLSQYEAARLFIERALAVNPHFIVNDENAPALSRICFHLDGIPLAIELAAARIKVLSLDKINERLDDRFKLLTGGKRTSLPRQKTLRALIDWSHDLLSEKEKLFWRRLSVFGGEWKLEAAEEVCCDDDLDAFEALDLMNELNSKSIIVYNESKDSYRMLETIRQYGQEKLFESGESDKMKTNHLNYYLRMVEAAYPGLFGPNAKELFDKLEAEHTNIQTALSWTLEKKSCEEGNRLVCALDNYWKARGYNFESGIWLEKLMTNPQILSPEVLARSNQMAGSIEKYRGNHNKSKEFFEASLVIYRSLGNKMSISAVLNSLGVSVYILGDYALAEKYFTESLQLSREIGNKKIIATTINSMGLIALLKYQFEKAKEYFEETLKIAKEIGDRGLTGIGLNNLAVVETHLGEYEKAEQLYTEVLKLNKELGNKTDIARSLTNLGDIAHLRNDFERAQSLLMDSLSISREIGSMERTIDSLIILGHLSLAKGESGPAKTYYMESMNLQKESPDFQLVLSILTGMAAVNFNEGKPEAAALLIGVVKSKLDSTGTGLEVSDKILFEKTLDAIKRELGNDKTLSQFEKGKEISLEQAVELAMNNEQ